MGHRIIPEPVPRGRIVRTEPTFRSAPDPRVFVQHTSHRMLRKPRNAPWSRTRPCTPGWCSRDRGTQQKRPAPFFFNRRDLCKTIVPIVHALIARLSGWDNRSTFEGRLLRRSNPAGEAYWNHSEGISKGPAARRRRRPSTRRQSQSGSAATLLTAAC